MTSELLGVVQKAMESCFNFKKITHFLRLIVIKGVRF